MKPEKYTDKFPLGRLFFDSCTTLYVFELGTYENDLTINDVLTYNN